MAEYSDFTPGNFSYNDIINSGSAGFGPSDYGDIGRAFNFSDESTGPSTPGLWDNLASSNPYYNEGSKIYTPEGFTPEYQSLLNNLQFNNSWDNSGNRTWNAVSSSNPNSTWSKTFKPDSNLDKFVGTVAPMAFSAAFGGGLSNLFGGGFLGGAAGRGLTSGIMSAGQGGSFGRGLVSGAIGGGLEGLAAGVPDVVGNNPSAFVSGTPGTSIAGLSGVTNPVAAGMINRGSGSFLGALASGKSGSEALQSGLTGAALSGINSAGRNAMDYMSSLKGWLGTDTGPNDMGLDSLQGSGGDMSGQTDVSPNRYEEMVSGPDGTQTYNPDYGFGGDQLANTFSSGLAPQQSIQSAGQSEFSLPSVLGNVGGRMGNFALNNAGDLASMLYGFYNNRKQQKAIGDQVNTLQGMYGQNSPYAQQLRNTLNAKAAAGGRRSNVAGRETQLQAMLADRTAQMQPNLLALNQARGGLQNNNMNMLLQGMNKLGGFNALGSGLKSLFGNNTYQDGGFNLTGMQNPYGSDVAFNNWGG